MEVARSYTPGSHRAERRLRQHPAAARRRRPSAAAASGQSPIGIAAPVANVTALTDRSPTRAAASVAAAPASATAAHQGRRGRHRRQPARWRRDRRRPAVGATAVAGPARRRPRRLAGRRGQQHARDASCRCRPSPAGPTARRPPRSTTRTPSRRPPSPSISRRASRSATPPRRSPRRQAADRHAGHRPRQLPGHAPRSSSSRWPASRSLILAALVAIYLVLGILYESYIHPLTVLSTLPSAGVGAVIALIVFHIEFSHHRPDRGHPADRHREEERHPDDRLRPRRRARAGAVSRATPSARRR